MKAIRNFPFDAKPLSHLFVNPSELKLLSPLSGDKFDFKLFKNFYATKHDESWLFFDEKERLIGHLGLIYSEVDAHPYLCHLYLVEELRGSGKAELLLRFAEKKVKADGRETIRLNVRTINQRARRFYQKMNYELIESAPDKETYQKILK